MEDISTSKKVQHGTVDMRTATTWMMISLMGAILAVAGGIIGSWALLAASDVCLIVLIVKVVKFYIPLQQLSTRGHT